MDDVLTFIMAGGVGERLQPLTKARAKAAVPFGGKFRLIDFTLSNCVNSGLRKVYVLTQYLSDSLNRHILEGWGISSAGLGDFVYCVPAQQRRGLDWYEGTADAVRQNLNLVRQNLNLMRKKGAEDILILSGDHVYKMNYLRLITYHRKKKAGLTISAIRTTRELAAGRLGVLEIDKDYRLVGFEEKPTQPKTMQDAPDCVLSSMGIYIFKLHTLLDCLQGEGKDFANNIIPQMIGKSDDIFVYDFDKENRIEDFEIIVNNGVREKILVDKVHDSAYWMDVGTIDSYYEASMDLAGLVPAFNLYGERWPIRTCQRSLPPSKYVLGGCAKESIVSDGCIVSSSHVWQSILSPGVIVEKDSFVERAIIFDDVIIEPGVRIRHAIVDKQVRIMAGASIGYNSEADKMRGCTISDTGIVVVPKDAVIEPV